MTALDAIYAVIRKIPRGKIATYGEIAEVAGLPRGHRIVARAVKTCPDGLPWYRVVGKKDPRRARIAIGDPAHIQIQRARLEAEGLRFDATGCIDIRRYGWLSPGPSTKPDRPERKPAARRPRKQSKRSARKP